MMNTYYKSTAERAVHIFTNNDLDSKFAASLMYEYFKRHRKDVTKYFIHYTEHNALIADVHTDDIIVLIKYMLYNDETIKELDDILSYWHDVIWIDNSEASHSFTFDERFHKFKETWKVWFTFKCENFVSVTKLAYNYITNSMGYDCSSLPYIIQLIDECTLIYSNPILEQFSYGINECNISAKNAIRVIFNHNGDLDIFNYNKQARDAENKFIESVLSLGEDIMSYNSKSEDIGTLALVYDFIYNMDFTICAINTDSDNPYKYKNKLNAYDIICLYHRNNADKWVYELFTGDSTRVNCAKIAYYLNTDDTKIESNTRQRAKFYSNTCLFDHGNEFIIKKKIFSNNHKVIIAQDGDMKSIIF